MWPFTNSAAGIVDEKRAHREEAIALAVNSIHDEGAGVDRSHILSATASQIVRNISEGHISAVGVMEAFIERASQAHAETNCLTEIMFAQALKEADALDREFMASKALRGPLHGVPFSLKDQFDMNGFDSTIGFTQWANQPRESDARLVEILRAAGAIPFVKTNVPQTMLSLECRNPLWGQTTNPYSSRHTCGGSSGGEAALLSMDGSVIGLGSDIGGSLRIPAAWCGVYSLKPVSGRFSRAGATSANPGFEGVKAVTGPMARCIDDLELVCRAVFGHSSYTAEGLPPVPYRDVTLPQRLRFGYYLSDNTIKASPANQRAVLETVEALRKAGHECVEFQVPDVPLAMHTFVAITSSDGYQTLLSHLGPDKKDESLWLVTLGPTLNSLVRATVSWLLSTFVRDPIFGGAFRSSRVKSVREYYTTTRARDEYSQLFYREVWEKHQFDGIIAPALPTPAIPHGASKTFSAIAISTILYNIVDSPVGIVPVTRVDASKDALTDEWRASGGNGSKVWESGIYNGRGAIYNPEAMKGLPVSVQIVGKSWEDEKVIEMMKVVDQALKTNNPEHDFGPGAWSRRADIKEDGVA